LTTDFVADSTEGFAPLFRRASDAFGVGEIPLADVASKWPDGEFFSGGIAHSHDAGKMFFEELGDIFGALGGDVYAYFFHYFDRERVAFHGVHGGASRYQIVARVCSEKPFGHLTARGVASGEEQDFRLVVHFGLPSLSLHRQRYALAQRAGIGEIGYGGVCGFRVVVRVILGTPSPWARSDDPDRCHGCRPAVRKLTTVGGAEAARTLPSHPHPIGRGDAMHSMPMWHSMSMFGFVDVILAGVIVVTILIAVIATVPDLVRTMKIHSM
jgi:hypothetical protein